MDLMAKHAMGDAGYRSLSVFSDDSVVHKERSVDFEKRGKGRASGAKSAENGSKCWVEKGRRHILLKRTGTKNQTKEVEQTTDSMQKLNSSRLIRMHVKTREGQMSECKESGEWLR
jgi:hypothetical protein